MRRTMIFRSSCALAVMALSLFGVRAVHAQDDPAPAPAQGRAHIVESGETLWDLAQQYFGDPFLWPSIYRLNTQRSQGSRVGRMGETGYRSVLPGQFYAAGFLTERDRLPWSSVVGALDRTTLGRLSAVTTARIFGSVELRAPASAVYHMGDTLLTVRRGRDIDGWGRVIGSRRDSSALPT